MPLSVEEIKQLYPMHYYVWHDDIDALYAYLQEHPNVSYQIIIYLINFIFYCICLQSADVMYDNHGRNPLMLALAMNHKPSALMLARHFEELIIQPDKDGFNGMVTTA